MTNTQRKLTATAAHVNLVRLGGATEVQDGNTGRRIGQADLIRGFAHYTGARGSAHEGVTAIVRGGLDGLRAALREGLLSGRDDRR